MTLSRRARWILFGGGIFAVIVVGLVWNATQKDPLAGLVTDVVTRGTVARTVDITGTLESVTDLSLSLTVSGRVAEIPVAVGNVVAAGDPLIFLDGAELDAQTREAMAAVAQAQAELDLRSAGSTPQDIAVAQANLAAAQSALARAFLDEARVRDVSTAMIAQEEASFAQVDAANTELFVQSRQDLVVQLQTMAVEIRAALAAADEIVGVENTLLNDDKQQVLGNQDSTTMSTATLYFQIARPLRDAAERAVTAFAASTDVDAVTAYTAMVNAIAASDQLLLAVARVLDATSADTREFSTEDLLAQKANIAAARTSLHGSDSALRGAAQAYDTALRSMDDATTDATTSRSVLIATRAAADATAATAVASAQATLAVRQAEWEKATAAPRDLDLAALRFALERAQATRDLMLARQGNGVLVAPVAGVIADITVDVGEVAAANTALVTLIADGGAYQLTLDVAESDILAVAVGMEADVTFSALGEDRIFGAEVIAVDPAEHLVEDVVFYTATLVLRAHPDAALLRPGMSADVTVHTDARTDVLMVPQRAVLRRDDGSRYVRILVGETVEERTVMIGLRGDAGMVEIIDGVAQGDRVVVRDNR